MDAITLTFGDCMENHVGMQKVGSMHKNGYNLADLNRIREFFESKGVECDLVNLRDLLSDGDVGLNIVDDAFLLVVKNGLNAIDPALAFNLYFEHAELQHDKKYYDNRRGKVLNKIARWNLCFDSIPQDADFESKKGTNVGYDSLPSTKTLKDVVAEITGDNDLKLEANYYYDIKKCGIGFHGDSERKKVVAIRLGSPNKLAFRWYHESKPLGSKYQITLSNGDMYVMSEKAVGTDWKKRSKFTLRHSAGSDKYTCT